MFKILPYLQPTWYFNISPGHDYGYFLQSNAIEQMAGYLKHDDLFSPAGRDLELAYRAHKFGIINKNYEPGINWWNKSEIPLLDEYLFARKYFHTSRIALAFVARILTLHNPIKEFIAYRNSFRMKKLNVFNNDSVPEGFKLFSFKYITEQPFITVVIPTLNRYKFLSDVLQDLERQDYTNFNVIVVDQSEPFNEEFYKNFKLDIQTIRQEEKSLWLARNTAIQSASGHYIALSEDDVRIPQNWITNHLKCIEYFNADISNGVFFPTGQQIPSDKSFFKWSDQFATGNAFLKRSVFFKTGLFDRQFEKQRMGDGEFGMRAYKAGLISIMNPLAFCEDVKADTGGLRENGNWDAYRPKNIWSMRPVPSVLYFYRKYFGVKATLLSLFYNIPPSIVPYSFKRNKKMLIIGSLLSIILFPLILFQVFRSWRKSSEMLKKPMIGSLYE